MEAILRMGGADEGAEGAAAGEPLRPRLEAELPRLRAYARRLVGGAEAEDLVQEVVARALRYASSFDTRRALGPWLRTMARRTWIDQRARSQGAPGALEQEPAAVAREHERVDLREDLAKALERLSAVEREVLLRFHGRGQSVREIARDTGLAEGTIKSHLHRARRRLTEEGA